FMVTPAAPGAAQGKSAARVIEMTGTDNLRFTPDTIQAKPGERLKVVLKTQSALPKIAMAHNFVLPQPTVDIQKFVTASASSPKTDYIAPDFKDQLIAASGLAGNGETVEVEFNAPKTAGSYTFVCTFPGHFQGGMKGTLIVK
ncbi:MAG TPA: plastocyanin/azurin family copper-binding protein, partial [Vicinamibacterales bacterium]